MKSAVRQIRSAMKALLTLRGAEGGNVAVLFAVSLPLVVGGAGLGVETTYWRYKQLQLQSAADAAAYAGAVEKMSGGPNAAVEGAATLAATQNGFAAGPGSDVVVNSPATSGAVTDPNAVEVELTAQAARFFTAYFSNAPVQLRARAVAIFNTSGASACVLALHPGVSQAVLLSGGAKVNMKGCSIMANSIADDAVVVQGSSELAATCLISGGGVSLSQPVTLSECSAPVTQASRAADPYRDLPAPPADEPCQQDNKPSLTPGTYCGIEVTGSKTLAPGVYVISGGDFRLNGGAEVTGSGVTIYLKGDARVRMNGNANVDLSAPTSGPYSGVLFFGDREASGGSNNVFNGSADSLLTGALYFPSQGVEYRGNFSGKDGCTQVVARTVQWSGSTEVAMDCSSLGMAKLPVLSVVKLAE